MHKRLNSFQLISKCSEWLFELLLHNRCSNSEWKFKVKLRFKLKDGISQYHILGDITNLVNEERS